MQMTLPTGISSHKHKHKQAQFSTSCLTCVCRAVTQTHIPLLYYEL